MTHLGIASAIAAAALGFRVIGHDAEANLVGRLDRQYFPILEPDLDRLLAANRDRISFSATASDLSDCDIVYIAADVPTDDEGASDLPAITARPNRPDLTSSRGRRCSCCSLPSAARFYTLRFRENSLPKRCCEILDAFGCPILTMRYEYVGLAKISINFCLVASIAVANVLAELSESIDADWAEIAPALRLDRRIGAHAYLDPGVGIAGGNSSAISGPCSISPRGQAPMSA
jgi:UDPglucose 6-dehydrogenase